MGGKNQTSTSTNTPTAQPQLQDIWNRVQQVASTPYTPYSGQLVAGLTPTQQSGIDNTNAAVGTAQPYIDQATQYANSGASAIDPSQIARYTNPYTQSVINSTQANFNEGNQQQAQQLKSGAIAQGAFGGDRTGVAQGELARQQQLAQAPVIAGLQNQNFAQALQAAQQDRAAQSQGAYALSNLGGQAQNAALQGAQAQLGAGAVQQGTQQNQLSADYNQYLQALAFPYQQAQFLQGALPALTAQGGATTNTTPGPNIFSQIAGLGVAGLGATGGLGWKPFGSSAATNAFGGQPASSPAYNLPYGPGYASGGAVGAKDDMGDFVKSVASIRNALSRGGYVAVGMGAPRFANGGPTPFNFNDRWGDLPSGPPAQDDGAGSEESAIAFMGAPQSTPAVTQTWRDDTDFAQGAPGATAGLPVLASQASGRGLPPEILAPGGTSAGDSNSTAMSFAPTASQSPYSMSSPTAAMSAPSDAGASSESPSENGGLFNLSPEANQALIAAGLGMAASRSPFALSAIGEGGLKGLETYSAAKKASSDKALAQSRIDQQAKQMAQQAEQFAKNLDLHTKTADETAKYHQGLLERENNKFIGTNEDGFPVFRDTRTGKETIGETKLQGKAPSGYARNPDGTMTAIKGGPADPEIVKGIASAKQGKPLPDDTADFLAERVIAGDGKALVGLGRGSQGAENISRIQGLVAQKARERGMDASDILAKTAEQSGLTAQQRTFGNQVAKMAVNATEAQGAIDLGRKVSETVPRGNWVPVNKIINAYRVTTSDPALAKFAASNLAIVNTYARAISPTGTPTVHDKEEAIKVLSTAQGADAYNAVLDQMNDEINIAHAAPLKAKKEMETIRKSGKSDADIAAPKATASPIPNVPPAADRKVGQTYQTPKGPATWQGTGWQLVQ